MRVVGGLDALVSQYVAEKLGMDVTRGTPCTTMAVYDSDDTFVAGIVFFNYRVTDIEMGIASETPNWAKKGVLAEIFGYVFDTLGCARTTAVCKNHSSTKRTRRFLKGLGYELEGNLRRAYDGHHGALVYGLLAEDCRFRRGA